MKWNLLVRLHAEVDLKEAIQWYERQRPGLGADFLEEIDRAMDRLAGEPERYPLYYRGFRRMLTKRFPYRIFYRLEGDEIIVFRILHQKREHSVLLPSI